MKKRIITTETLEEDQKIEGSLRPQYLEDYIGQTKAKETLKIYIEAAKARGEALDHVLFYGPPGLGKTTLAGIIANELGVNMKVTSGPAIEKPGEMAAILNNLQERDVLFVDEIHRLNRQVEEVLYPCYRYRHWQGSWSQVDPPGFAEVYAGGSDDQSRDADRASARPFWCGEPAGILYDGGAANDCTALGTDARCGD